jgi:hypothetical protein
MSILYSGQSNQEGFAFFLKGRRKTMILASLVKLRTAFEDGMVVDVDKEFRNEC